MYLKRVALVAGLIALLSSVGASQQQPAATPTALPSPVPREPSWAFQVQGGSLPAETATPKSVPGSTREYTPAQIDDLRNPPDWFPDQHPPAAARVVKGEGNLMACGSCHLMNGEGHPESATVSGFTADYFIQQMNDFRSGVRKDFANRMDLIAKAMTDQEIREVAQYFAALKPRPFTTVREAATVPKTFVGQGRMRFVDPRVAPSRSASASSHCPKIRNGRGTAIRTQASSPTCRRAASPGAERSRRAVRRRRIARSAMAKA